METPHKQQADEYWLQEDYAAAIEAYEAAISLNTHDYRNYWYLGLIQLLQGQIDTAQLTWFSAIENIEATKLDAAIANLIEILESEAERQFHLRAWHLAERIYEQLLSLNPTSADFFLSLGYCYSYQGYFDEAISAWQNAAALKPHEAEPYREQGIIRQKLQEFPEAIDAYTQAIELQPTGELHHYLGCCLVQLQQWSAAVWHLQQAQTFSPENISVEGDLAQVWMYKYNWQVAIDNLHNIVYKRTHFASQYIAWADHRLLESELQANTTFLKVLADPTANLVIKIKLADLLLRSGQIELVTSLYQNILQEVSEEPQAKMGLRKIQELITQHKQSETNLAAASPVCIYDTTEEWSTTHQGDHDYRQLDIDDSILLTPPKTIAPEIHFSFRFPREVPLPNTFVAIIPQGQFWLNQEQSSTAIIASNCLLSDLSPEFPLLSPNSPKQSTQLHQLFTSPNIPIQELEATIVVLSGLCNNMYFHWLFDILPRLDLIDRSGVKRSSIDGFLVSNSTSFQKETLSQLGIPASKILTPENYPHIQASQLIVPSFPGQPAWMSLQACQWLRRQFLDEYPKSSTRLYISRRETSNRRIINEDEVMIFLDKLGFQSVVLESFTVQEQATLLSSATVVVAPHGGGLSNLVFCAPETIVIEIFSPHFVYPCYWLISNLLHLQYYYIIGITHCGSYLYSLLYPNPRLEDIFVDVNQLCHILNLAGIQ
jgi:hypothetical protein